MTPPELATDAPVLDVVKPVVPGRFVEALGMDLHATVSDGPLALGSEFLAAQPPLRSEYGLNDVARSGTLGNLHRVILLFNKES